MCESGHGVPHTQDACHGAYAASGGMEAIFNLLIGRSRTIMVRSLGWLYQAAAALFISAIAGKTSSMSFWV